MSSEQANDGPTAKSATESVVAMKERFAALDRSVDSFRWAAAAYRLGMATAEQPTAHPEANLREALGYYQQAAGVLTIERAPVERSNS